MKANAHLVRRAPTPFNEAERAELRRQGHNPDETFAAASRDGSLSLVRAQLSANINGRARLADGIREDPNAIITPPTPSPSPQGAPSADVLGQIRRLLGLPNTATAEAICAAIQAAAYPSAQMRAQGRAFVALSATEIESCRRLGLDPQVYAAKLASR